MMTPNEITKLSVVTKSMGYNLFVDFIHNAFPTDEDFSNWIYADGADLSAYMLNIEASDVVVNICKVLEATFQVSHLQAHLKKIKDDKTSYKFISNWLGRRFLTDAAKNKIAKLPSGKRNLYSTLICVLLNNTKLKES